MVAEAARWRMIVVALLCGGSELGHLLVPFILGYFTQTSLLVLINAPLPGRLLRQRQREKESASKREGTRKYGLSLSALGYPAQSQTQLKRLSSSSRDTGLVPGLGRFPGGVYGVAKSRA